MVVLMRIKDEDLINKRFGKLVLLERVGVDKRGIAKWLCECDCGNKVIKSKAYFFRKNNPLRDCGCVKPQVIRIDLSGRRYGRWTVLSYVRTNENKRAFWLCRCDCGNEKVVAGTHLYNKHSRSCGCLSNEIRLRGMLPGEAGFNKLKKNYKAGARHRGLNFDLSDEEFKSIVTDCCYYCGKPPLKKIKADSENSIFFYNGIDRVDNLKGYQIDNVLPCCEKCNRMKSVFNKEDFLDQVVLIYTHLLKP